MKIYADRQNNKVDIAALAGKDLWVHAKVPDGTSYIKILNINNNGTVDYREVWDEYVDSDSSLEQGDAELWLYSSSPIYIHVDKVDAITIRRPVEVLTTDEMYEILLNHSSNLDDYESGYGEDEE